jgi:hypothetical protein
MVQLMVPVTTRVQLSVSSGQSTDLCMIVNFISLPNFLFEIKVLGHFFGMVIRKIWPFGLFYWMMGGFPIG